eukprot:115271-Ditylum_brightwellii.AAC.1
MGTRKSDILPYSIDSIERWEEIIKHSGPMIAHGKTLVHQLESLPSLAYTCALLLHRVCMQRVDPTFHLALQKNSEVDNDIAEQCTTI